MGGALEERRMYALSKGVYFVSGAKRGAVYDTNTGNVYLLNEIACRIVVGERSDPAFWARLRNLGLAEDESARLLTRQDLPILNRNFHLRFIWFEIVSDDCNQYCVHCYDECMPPPYRVQVGLPCVPKNSSVAAERKLTAGEWKILIAEGAKLGCKQCQFIGGEPFLYRGECAEDVLDLAAYARCVGYSSIEIFTNATLLDEEKVRRIRNLGLEVAVSL